MKNNFRKSIGVFVSIVIAAGMFGFGAGAGSEFIRDYLTKQSNNSISAADILNEPTINTSSYDYVMAATLSNVSANSVSGIFKSVKNSVVSINMKLSSVGMYNQVREVEGAGSGIIFKEDAEKIYIVTNYHVINSATSVTVSLDDLHQVKASYVGGDEEADLAIISVLKSDMSAEGFAGYTIAKFDNSGNVEVGDAAIAIGNALGEGKSATLGIISAVEKVIDIDGQSYSVLQTDAAINPGNSGGALVNSSANVIGINTAKLSEIGVEGMGYAIPSKVASKIINNILENGSVGRPYFGVSGITITAQHQKYYGFIKLGVYVNGVSDKSTAHSLGIKKGDLIVGYNGTTVESGNDLNRLIAATKTGDKIKIEVIRNNKTTVFLEGVMKSLPNTTNF